LNLAIFRTSYNKYIMLKQKPRRRAYIERERKSPGCAVRGTTAESLVPGDQEQGQQGRCEDSQADGRHSMGGGAKIHKNGGRR